MKSPPLLRRARRFLGRILDVLPPTWRGLLLAVLSGFSLWLYGFGHLDLVLYVIGMSGILLLALTSLMTAGTALWLRKRLPEGGSTKRRIEAGSPIRTGWNIPALYWMPLVKVRWEWLAPGDVEVRTRLFENVLREEIVARRRGHATQVKRRIVVEDPFGLARVAWVRPDPSEVTILPSRGQLRDMPVIQSKTGAEGTPYPTGAPEGDRMEIRRYTPGDSVRDILWKTYARTRQLNVRVPELSIERSKKTIAYLLAAPSDEPAAAAARVALEAGALGDQWIFGADGTHGSTDDLATALQAVAHSGSFSQTKDASGDGDGSTGEARDGQRTGLGSFLREVGNQGEVHCIVFVPPLPGEWTSEVLQAARDYPGTMSFVVGTDGVWRPKTRPWWRRLLFAEVTPSGTRLDLLGALLRQLGSVGRQSFVIDRTSGRSFNQAQQQALGASG